MVKKREVCACLFTIRSLDSERTRALRPAIVFCDIDVNLSELRDKSYRNCSGLYFKFIS